MKRKASKKHLYEIDLMRIIFIGGVLLTHITTIVTNDVKSNANAYLFMNSTHLIVHFVRMGFMFITGLVLTLNYYNRKNKWKRFYKRRFSGIFIPYVAWNVILLFFVNWIHGYSFQWKKFILTALEKIQFGNSFFLYYLLVIMQFYLLFPILLWLFKHYQKKQNLILLLSFIFQITILISIKYFVLNINTDHWWYLFRDFGKDVIVYQFYFIAGMYISTHYQKVIKFFIKKQKIIGLGTLFLALATIPLFFFDRNFLGLSLHNSHLPHQPFLFFYFLFMIALIFCLGLKYAYLRKHGLSKRTDQLILLFSRLSFGIFLSQTIPVRILGKIINIFGLNPWVEIILIPIFLAIVVVFSGLLTWMLIKIPPFGILVGKINFFQKKNT